MRKSLNQAAIAALAKGLGLADERMRFHDLDTLAGTWREDPDFNPAIAAQDQIQTFHPQSAIRPLHSPICILHLDSECPARNAPANAG